ncbi:MAG: hypothetical protein LBI26_03185 [Holosporales bacterium]|jgi:hypothetical protein|nr:hypothetical protein [Holosporales bacterium]
MKKKFLSVTPVALILSSLGQCTSKITVTLPPLVHSQIEKKILDIPEKSEFVFHERIPVSDRMCSNSKLLVLEEKVKESKKVDQSTVVIEMLINEFKTSKYGIYLNHELFRQEGTTPKNEVFDSSFVKFSDLVTSKIDKCDGKTKSVFLKTLEEVLSYSNFEIDSAFSNYDLDMAKRISNYYSHVNTELAKLHKTIKEQLVSKDSCYVF